MRFGINLRGDLAKLDDAEIAARYEALVEEKEAYIQSLTLIEKSKLGYRLRTGLFGRGLLHARIFYQLQMLLIGVVGILNGQIPDIGAGCRAYLRECELKDVSDEIRRRIAARKAAMAT